MRKLFLQQIVLAMLCFFVTATAFAAVDLSSPKLSAKSFYEALTSADTSAMHECMLIEGEPQQQLAGAFIDVIVAGRKMADAAKEKFGPTGDKLAAGPLNREDAAGIEKAEQNIQGDEAILKINSDGKPLKFRKTSAGWKLVLLDYAGQNPATGRPATTQTAGETAGALAGGTSIADQIKLLASLAAAMNDTSEDISQGRYPTTADAEAAIQQRFSEVMVKHYKPASSQPGSAQNSGQ